MSIDERGRRATAGGREVAGRAPRSGGRTAGLRTGDDIRRTPAGVREARHHDTQGTAALKLDPAEQLRVTAAAAPRLRVAPPAPIRTPRAPFVALVIAIVLAGVLGILWINTKTMENSFRIDQLQDQQSALDNQQQQLERQIANYENPGNLGAAARMLGLVKSDKIAYITLPNGDQINVPQPNNARPAITAKGTGAAGASTGDPAADASRDSDAAQGSGVTQNAGR